MLKKFFKPFLNYVYKPFVKLYLRKKRTVQISGLTIEVWPGVFHPTLFYSTKYLLQFLSGFDLNNKRLLELGCGTGTISCYAATKNAVVTAIDINQTAVANCTKNGMLNKVKVLCLQSDLFDKITNATFDYIIINPPYYAGNATNDEEQAWYCGSEYQYFEKLFFQLKNKNDDATVFMILSDECAIEKIDAIGTNYSLELKVVKEYSNILERNSIYEIKKRG